MKLPPPPVSVSEGIVQAWSEPVAIPTYPAMPPDRYPMFLEKRAYQGSSGRVYPNAITDRISNEWVDQSWEAVHLENEYVRLMILPEIGGRIHVGLDKTNGYDFFYRQNVIKPALVGLLGPWISGGVEFNWPQHHRPSTYMPVSWTIEEEPDGSRTVWLSEHDPMLRMKGMVGIRLRPGHSLVEARVRLYNRTPFVQTFLWWANVAVHVHDQYQSFFPPDVAYVADHAKRAMSAFPIARGTYYGVDYSRGDGGGTDLSWYRNIPVPTSYMAMGSHEDFFGGYDHRRDAGFVHVADHHIAPGKKQWTWGDHDFGYAWDRNLTETDGPYVELMAGVFTDNQPDFSFLQPYETKSFSQFWYPIQRIGPPASANLEAALSLSVARRNAHLGVAVTSAIDGARVRLTARSETLLEQSVELRPGDPFVADVELPPRTRETDLRISVSNPSGREVIAYAPKRRQQGEVPAPATEPPLPREIGTVEELFLTGLHLEQYRHATREPDAYWREALRREPADVRSNNALGLWHLRRGEASEAEGYFRRAIETLTRRNPNPYDGEPFYNLGLALRLMGRHDEAYDELYKATWNYAWRAPGLFALAEIDARREAWGAALEHLDGSLQGDASSLKARDLRAAVLRRIGEPLEALRAAEATLALDRLDVWAANERVLSLQALGRVEESERTLAGLEAWTRADPQTHLDLALDYAAAGLRGEAIAVLRRRLPARDAAPVHPMIHYALAWLLDQEGDAAAAAGHRSLAAAMPPDYVFPFRLDEIAILSAARTANRRDARAAYYLGNLLYDRRRHEEAIRCWEAARRLDPTFPIVLRNLGIAAFNVQRQPARARALFTMAFTADPGNSRLLYELDQLLKKLNEAPARRLARLKRHRDLVAERDDLTVELVTLFNELGRSDEALAVIGGRRFHPWEGGEGLVSGQYVLAHLRLGEKALGEVHPKEAKRHFAAAMAYPENLGEGKHLLTPENDLQYYLALACEALGAAPEARARLEQAARPAARLLSEATYWRALSLAKLGRPAEAEGLLRGLLKAARRQSRAEVRIDYFATSLPTFLLFDDDLQLRNRVTTRYLEGLALFGLGQGRRAMRAFRDVLELDVNHVGAATRLAAMSERPEPLVGVEVAEAVASSRPRRG